MARRSCDETITHVGKDMLTGTNSLSYTKHIELYPREPLNKSSAAVSGSFSSTLRYRKREIHTVFRRFRYLNWPKNLSLTALADLIRASLEFSQKSGKGLMEVWL